MFFLCLISLTNLEYTSKIGVVLPIFQSHIIVVDEEWVLLSGQPYESCHEEKSALLCHNDAFCVLDKS